MKCFKCFSRLILSSYTSFEVAKQYYESLSDKLRYQGYTFLPKRKDFRRKERIRRIVCSLRVSESQSDNLRSQVWTLSFKIKCFSRRTVSSLRVLKQRKQCESTSDHGFSPNVRLVCVSLNLVSFCMSSEIKIDSGQKLSKSIRVKSIQYFDDS